MPCWNLKKLYGWRGSAKRLGMLCWRTRVRTMPISSEKKALQCASPCDHRPEMPWNAKRVALCSPTTTTRSSFSRIPFGVFQDCSGMIVSWRIKNWDS